MAKTLRSRGDYSNQLLKSLSPQAHKRLSGHLQLVELTLKQSLCEPDGRDQFAYFVETGMVSVVATMVDSRSIEVGTIGKEGIVGGELALKTIALPFQRYVQIGGSGYRLNVEILRDEVEKNRDLRDRIMHVHAGYLIQSMQNAACNGLHTIEQRCCRWILTAQDHVGSDSVALTHEFLAIMLGVRRASVSEVLKPLQERGLIRYSRGALTILKRETMLQQVCECYGVSSQALLNLST